MSLTKTLWVWWNHLRWADRVDPSTFNPVRARNFQRLVDVTGFDVQLVTPHNMQEFVATAAPFHPGLQYLQPTHVSDYMRCYLLHHYGGGYSDVKDPLSTLLTYARAYRCQI